MTCVEAKRLLPGYLDDALPKAESHVMLSRHLDDCRECRTDLQRYVRMSVAMSHAARVAPPADLGVKIRVAVAHARETQGLALRYAQWRDHASLVLQNMFEPLALPATGGLLAALLVFAFIYQFLGAGVPLVAATADSPSNLLQPARLEMLAGFQMSGLSETTPAGQHALLVEATVGSTGEAVSYRILSGELDRSVQRQLDQVMLFSRFRPQLSFGKPTSGGRVVLSFSKISVRG